MNDAKKKPYDAQNMNDVDAMIRNALKPPLGGSNHRWGPLPVTPPPVDMFEHTLLGRNNGASAEWMRQHKARLEAAKKALLGKHGQS